MIWFFVSLRTEDSNMIFSNEGDSSNTQFHKIPTGIRFTVFIYRFNKFSRLLFLNDIINSSASVLLIIISLRMFGPPQTWVIKPLQRKYIQRSKTKLLSYYKEK